MTHLFGVPMQDNKHLWVSLAQIPGVGRSSSFFICERLGFAPRVLWKDMTLKQRDQVKLWIIKFFQGNSTSKPKYLGTQYWQEVRNRKAFLIKLGTIRGIRLRQGLPVRGQRTHSNGRTARRGSSSTGRKL